MLIYQMGNQCCSDDAHQYGELNVSVASPLTGSLERWRSTSLCQSSGGSETGASSATALSSASSKSTSSSFRRSSRKRSGKACSASRENQTAENTLACQIPAGEITLVFETAEGFRKFVTVTERPLGIKFSDVAPFVVNDVHRVSHAAKQGIQLGWTLKCIDEDECKSLSAVEMKMILLKKTSSLPMLS
mmetsp:Transcript_33995/g.90572  ORF Transcript_33995/g.90572 Transcript_33995/m.90572 type:complete len:189 (-) Transcript_33995:99-665(-)